LLLMAQKEAISY